MPRNFSYSRSPRRSRSRSRSPKRDSYHSSRYRDDRRMSPRRNDRYRSRDRSADRRNEDLDQCRIHIADLTDSVTQYDIEKAFMKFGEINEVWMAKNPPCFAFVVFKNKQDAATAVKEMDNK
jgi:arginine/serine-rich splicing factor 7